MSTQPHGQIFISYRRQDSQGSSGRLYDRLLTRFSRNRIFMDVDTIPSGADFVKFLQDSVANCEILIAIIGDRWLNITDNNGTRLLDKKDDFVRIEIAAALKRGIIVIPVLMDHAVMPSINELPDDLKPLSRRNAFSIVHSKFNADAEKLISVLQSYLNENKVWADLNRRGDISQLKKYLLDNPSGRFKEECLRAIKTKEAERDKSANLLEIFSNVLTNKTFRITALMLPFVSLFIYVFWFNYKKRTEESSTGSITNPIDSTNEKRQSKVKELLLKYDYVSPVKEGMSLIRIGNTYGFIDSNGNEKIASRFDHAESFSEGRGLVKISGDYGFVDTAGNWVIPAFYTGANSFHQGLAAVHKNGKWGFVDKVGNEVVSLKYGEVGSFNEDLAFVKSGDHLGLFGKYGYIDKNGNQVIPLSYLNGLSFSEGLASVKEDVRYKSGFIKKTGETAIPLKYETAESFSEGLAKVSLDGRVFFIDKSGAEVVTITNKYDRVYSFSEGMCMVSNYTKGGPGKYGYIDKTGSETIPVSYDFGRDFSGGIAEVGKDNKYGYIDKSGKEIIPVNYTSTFGFTLDSLVALNTENETLFYDRKGNIVLRKSLKTSK